MGHGTLPEETMLIEETVFRECCDANRDLVPIPGAPKACGAKTKWYFCRHCGKHFEDLGGSEPESPGLQPCPWPWEA